MSCRHRIRQSMHSRSPGARSEDHLCKIKICEKKISYLFVFFNYFKYWSYLLLTFYVFGNAEMELFRHLLETWHAVENIHPSQNPYSVHEPVYQASLLSITENLLCNTNT